MFCSFFNISNIFHCLHYSSRLKTYAHLPLVHQQLKISAHLPYACMYQGHNPASEAWYEARLILKSLWNGNSAFLPKIRMTIDSICLFPCLSALPNPINFPHPIIPSHPLFTAPSPVMTIKKDRTSRNSISLSWQEPEHPNGIILDYEVKYYEKVGR